MKTLQLGSRTGVRKSWFIFRYVTSFSVDGIQHQEPTSLPVVRSGDQNIVRLSTSTSMRDDHQEVKKQQLVLFYNQLELCSMEFVFILNSASIVYHQGVKLVKDFCYKIG